MVDCFLIWNEISSFLERGDPAANDILEGTLPVFLARHSRSLTFLRKLMRGRPLAPGEPPLLEALPAIISKPETIRSCPERHLRLLQWQSLLRLKLWALYGSDAVVNYSVRKRRTRMPRPQDSLPTTNALLGDATRILSQVALLRSSPSDLHFSFVLQEWLTTITLPTHIRRAVWAFFELRPPPRSPKKHANGDIQSPLDCTSPAATAISPPPRKPLAKRKRTGPSLLMTQNCSNPEPVESPLIPTEGKAILLTSHQQGRSNALLQNSRPRFLANHFTTNLSNPKNLFRQVKTVSVIRNRRMEPQSNKNQKPVSIPQKTLTAKSLSISQPTTNRHQFPVSTRSSVSDTATTTATSTTTMFAVRPRTAAIATKPADSPQSNIPLVAEAIRALQRRSAKRAVFSTTRVVK